MPSYRHAPIPFVAAVALAATCCASRGRPGDPTPDGVPKLFADSTPRSSGGLSTRDPRDAPSFPPEAPVNPALRPDDPWIGVVGVKLGVGADCELGVGLCVPGTPTEGRPPDVTQLDRARRAAADVWLKFDF